jgi:hypothetical protein
MPKMETTTHYQQSEITAEKRSPFRPHRGLAAPDLFLDTMLIGEQRRHAQLTVLKSWVTYTGTDPYMSPEGKNLPRRSTGRVCSFRRG